jgi:hypothetical protein
MRGGGTTSPGTPSTERQYMNNYWDRVMDSITKTISEEIEKEISKLYDDEKENNHEHICKDVGSTNEESRQSRSCPAEIQS